ncbi:hypothetical protein ACH4TP_38130 [Streptomyces sp. NPDC021012]|uniref:DUF6197 family protein n=1 Tax=Streptomyces sp. NPDC021012 TaxID=3365107 RepID=UPI0037B1C346
MPAPLLVASVAGTRPPAVAPRPVVPSTPRSSRAPHPLRVPPLPPAPPTWGQRLVPRPAQQLLAGLGMWQTGTPLPPSLHLLHTLSVLETYGWCKSLDLDPAGRLCIRGAQTLLEKTGHVTPNARERAVDHMHTVLEAAGVRMQFFAWNDLPGRTFPHVKALLTRAAEHAHTIGD